MLTRILSCTLLAFAALCHASPEQIQGANRSEAIAFIEQFPTDEYQIHHIPGLGDFYIDAKKDHIKDVLRTGHPWEPKIQQLLSELIQPNTTVLDIGAHIGTHTLTMSHSVGNGGKVLAFEPQPKIFRELFLNMQLNGVSNVDFYPAAVGDHDGTIELSPFTQSNEGGTSLLNGGTGQFVPLITIDSLNLNHVDLMKIDVELMENFVLDGARSTIARCHPTIIIEIQKNYALEKAPPKVKNQILATIVKLEGMGYRVIPIGGADYLASFNR